jgi:hypothetical protein
MAATSAMAGAWVATGLDPPAGEWICLFYAFNWDLDGVRSKMLIDLSWLI